MDYITDLEFTAGTTAWTLKSAFEYFRCQTTNSPIRAWNIYESSPFSRKKFLSLCSIVKTTEWNGLIFEHDSNKR
jgi:hypothetical protein